MDIQLEGRLLTWPGAMRRKAKVGRFLFILSIFVWVDLQTMLILRDVSWGEEESDQGTRFPNTTEWEQLYGFPAGHIYGLGYVGRGDGDPKAHTFLLNHC